MSPAHRRLTSAALALVLGAPAVLGAQVKPAAGVPALAPAGALPTVDRLTARAPTGAELLARLRATPAGAAQLDAVQQSTGSTAAPATGTLVIEPGAYLGAQGTLGGSAVRAALLLDDAALHTSGNTTVWLIGNNGGQPSATLYLQLTAPGWYLVNYEIVGRDGATIEHAGTTLTTCSSTMMAASANANGGVSSCLALFQATAPGIFAIGLEPRATVHFVRVSVGRLAP